MVKQQFSKLPKTGSIPVHLLMLNNFILAEESSEVFVSYGKVITNKDGIIEIVGLDSNAIIDNDLTNAAIACKWQSLYIASGSMQIEDSSANFEKKC